MNKIIPYIFIISFFSFTLIPHLQNRAFKLNHYRLGGYETKIQFPDFNFLDFLEGKFQEQTAKYISQYIGLRSYFVRTDNQISVSVFGQLSPKTSPQVVIGKDKMLFERAYIRELNDKYDYDPLLLEKTAEDLLKLQNYLNKKDKAFLLLISPSKAELYSENIPKQFIKSKKELPERLNLFRQFLDQRGVNYIDGPKYFANLKQDLKIPLFSHTGTHWTYYPTCLFLSKALQQIEQQIPVKLINLNCGEPKLVSWPIGTDKDLLHLLNVWKTKKYLKNTNYSASSIKEDSDTVRPNVLIVGTSFVWQLLKYIDKYNIFAKRDYFYYFNVNYSKRGSVARGKIDKSNLNLKNILENKDVVLIEINEINIDSLGYGFLDETNKIIN